MEQFASRFIRHLKFEASILRQTKREQSEFLRKEVSNADKFRQLILTGGILNLSSSVDSRIPNLRNAIRTARKPRNRGYTYWKNLPIGHSHFRIESYSCWHRLNKGVVWLLRCKNRLRARTGKAGRPPSVSADPLVPSELQAAETAIVGFVQGKHFKEELKALESKGAVMKKSLIYLLEPFLDEERIVQVGGRLRNAPLSEKARHPVIVPKNHRVSKLVVRRAHEFQNGHSGKEYVLALIRQKFWIVGARPLIKRVVKEFMVCRKLRGNPQVQRMADFPFDRVTPGKPPFSFVGVDCFGPFVVKRGRTQIKRYGCLFTCLTNLIVPIEKLDSLEADSFINGFVRFCARIGVPENVRSDNGTNFFAGEKELREAMRSWKDAGKVKAHLLQKEIKWGFNPPAASHMGKANQIGQEGAEYHPERADLR